VLLSRKLNILWISIVHVPMRPSSSIGLLGAYDIHKICSGVRFKIPQVQREASEIKITNITVQSHSWGHDWSV